MFKDKLKNIALDGTVRQNPTFRLVLGTCPTLALTSMALDSLVMGIAVTFVLLCSNVIISLLRNVIPDRVLYRDYRNVRYHSLHVYGSGVALVVRKYRHVPVVNSC